MSACSVRCRRPAPLNGVDYWVTPSQAKALGLVAANGTSVDGYVGFGSASQFAGDTATGGFVAPNTYDFFGAAVHEITEVMGRTLLTGQSFGGLGQGYSLLDLLHYIRRRAPGFLRLCPRIFSRWIAASPIWASSSTEAHSVRATGPRRWASSPFDAFGTPGVADPVSSNDLTVMDAIGWNPSARPRKSHLCRSRVHRSGERPEAAGWHAFGPG